MGAETVGAETVGVEAAEAGVEVWPVQALAAAAETALTQAAATLVAAATVAVTEATAATVGLGGLGVCVFFSCCAVSLVASVWRSLRFTVSTKSRRKESVLIDASKNALCFRSK